MNLYPNVHNNISCCNVNIMNSSISWKSVGLLIFCFVYEKVYV